MQEEEFKRLLLLATEQAKQFALNYIENELAPVNVYKITLSTSHDDPALTQFALYPDDIGKVVEMADVATTITTLLRKGKVPVWIDISVSEITENKTVCTLLCAGRYSDNINEFYYRQTGLGPFGVKSPNLPVDYKDGTKFRLRETQNSFWKDLLERIRR